MEIKAFVKIAVQQIERSSRTSVTEDCTAKSVGCFTMADFRCSNLRLRGLPKETCRAHNRRTCFQRMRQSAMWPTVWSSMRLARKLSAFAGRQLGKASIFRQQYPQLVAPQRQLRSLQDHATSSLSKAGRRTGSASSGTSAMQNWEDESSQALLRKRASAKASQEQRSPCTSRKNQILVPSQVAGSQSHKPCAKRIKRTSCPKRFIRRSVPAWRSPQPPQPASGSSRVPTPRTAADRHFCSLQT